MKIYSGLSTLNLNKWTLCWWWCIAMTDAHFGLFFYIMKMLSENHGLPENSINGGEKVKLRIWRKCICILNLLISLKISTNKCLLKWNTGVIVKLPWPFIHMQNKHLFFSWCPLRICALLYMWQLWHAETLFTTFTRNWLYIYMFCFI